MRTGAGIGDTARVCPAMTTAPPRGFWWEHGLSTDRLCLLEAVIFDVDGILADTERDGHRPAFNAAFAAHGLDVSWTPDDYGRLLAIRSGRRRIAHDLRSRGFAAADRLAAAVHSTKTAMFARRVLDGEIGARPGLPRLIGELRNCGIRVAVASTGSRAWVEPLVRDVVGDGIAEVLITGDEVSRGKPDPEVYLRALDELDLAPESVLAVEDSQPGLRAARRAGLATVVVTNDYTAGQDFTGAAAVFDGFDGRTPLGTDGCRQAHHRHHCLLR